MHAHPARAPRGERGPRRAGRSAGAPYKHTPNATALGSGGAAATVDSVATGAARDVLRKGGNAVDAAVAAAAVLGVTEPYSSGIGGGGFMVIRRPDGKVTTIDSREKAPASMRPDSFIENGTPLAFNDARYSGLSAGVPGTPAGWAKALRKYGTWRLQAGPGAGHRRRAQGLRGRPDLHLQTDPNVPWFDDIPATAALYLDPDGTSRDSGEVVKNPDMAQHLRADRALRRQARLLPRPGGRGDGPGRRAAADRRRPPTRPGGPA